jgi:hypothetical protein
MVRMKMASSQISTVWLNVSPGWFDLAEAAARTPSGAAAMKKTN